MELLKKNKKKLIPLISIILFCLILNNFFMTSKYNDNYWYDENKIIIKKKLKNHYQNFSPIDLIRQKDFFKEVNKKNFFIFSGISNTSTVLSCDDHLWIKKLDKYGFNNKSENWENAKIYAFGDSLVFGSCAKENFIDIWNRNKKEKIINLSSPGNIFPIDVALLKELIIKQKKNIKQVYFFIYEPSLDFLYLAKKNQILRKYSESKNFNLNYFQNKNEIDLLLRKVYEEHMNLYTEGKYLNDYLWLINKFQNLIKKNHFTKKNDLKNKFTSENFDLFIKYKQVLDELSNEKNFTYEFIFIPQKKYYLSDDKEIYKKVKEYLNKNQKRFYEIRKLFPESKLDEFYIEYSNHFSYFGHKLMGNLFDTLK